MEKLFKHLNVSLRAFAKFHRGAFVEKKANKSTLLFVNANAEKTAADLPEMRWQKKREKRNRNDSEKFRVETRTFIHFDCQCQV